MPHVDKEPDSVPVPDGVRLGEFVEHTLPDTVKVGIAVALREPDMLTVIVVDELDVFAPAKDVTPEDDDERVMDTVEHALAEGVCDMPGDRLPGVVGETLTVVHADADAHIVGVGLPENVDDSVPLKEEQPDIDSASETVAVTHAEVEIEAVDDIVPLDDRLDECELVIVGEKDDEVHTDTVGRGDEVELAEKEEESDPLAVGLEDDDCISETVDRADLEDVVEVDLDGATLGDSFDEREPVTVDD